MTALMSGIHDMLANLVSSAPAPTPTSSGTVTSLVTTTPEVTGPATHAETADSSGTTFLSIATLLAALVAAVVAGLGIYFQHRTRRESVRAANKAADAAEVSAKAADEDSRTKRYDQAVDQLRNTRAPVRYIGFHTLVQLADEWPEGQQDCIDAICSYVRSAKDDEGDILLRHMIVRILHAHLCDVPVTASWSQRDFDFRGAVLRDLDFRTATFHRAPNFSQARFEGNCHFEGVTFEEGAGFDDCVIEGHMELADVDFRAQTSFDKSVIEEGGILTVHPRPLMTSSEVSYSDFVVRGRLALGLPYSPSPQGKIHLTRVLVESRGEVTIGSSGEMQQELQWRAAAPDSTRTAMDPSFVARDWSLRKGACVTIDQRLLDAGIMHWDNPEVEDGAELKFVARRLS